MSEKTLPTKAMQWIATLACSFSPVISANALSSDDHTSARVIKPQWVMLGRIQVANEFPQTLADLNSIDTGAHPSIDLRLNYERVITRDGIVFTAQTVRYNVDCAARLLRPTKVTYTEIGAEAGHVSEGGAVDQAKSRLGFQDLPIRRSFLGTICFLHKYGLTFPDMSHVDDWAEVSSSSPDYRTFRARNQILAKQGLILEMIRTVWNQAHTSRELPFWKSNTENAVIAYDCKAGESRRIISVQYTLSGNPLAATLFVGPLDTPQNASNNAELAKRCPARTSTLPNLDITSDMHEGWVALTEALKAGKLDSVMSYLAAHPSALNKPIPMSLMTPLEVALEYEHLDLAEALIGAGADVNFAGPGGVTNLHRAVYFNRMPVVLFLLKHGAYTGSRDDAGRDPLYYAAEHGSAEAAVAIVKEGASPDSLDSTLHPPGERRPVVLPPLSTAIVAKNKDVAMALIDMGANPNLADPLQPSPLDYAALNPGWSDVVKRLLEKGARCERVRDHRSGVVAARDAKSFRLVSDCIARSTGKVPDLTMSLRMAAMSGNNDALKALLEMGARPNQATMTFDMLPLSEALQSPTPIETMEILVNAGANVNIVNPGGTTLLHSLPLQFRPKNPEILDWLLQRGGDINAPVIADPTGAKRPSQGYTPLHLAAQNGQTELGRLMIERGANVNAIALDGQTPLTLAIRNQRREMAHLLIARGAQADGQAQHGATPLQVATEAEDVGTMRLLLDKGANPNKSTWTDTDRAGRSPLTTAVLANSVPMVELLLKHGADPNLADGTGALPLDLAINQNQAEMVDLLTRSHAYKTASDTGTHSLAARVAARRAEASLCTEIARMEQAGQLGRKEFPLPDETEWEFSSDAVDQRFFPEYTTAGVTIGQRQFVIGRTHGDLTFVIADAPRHWRLLCTFTRSGRSIRVQSPAARLVMFAKASFEDPVTFALRRPGVDDVETLLDGIGTQAELAFLKGRDGLTAMLYRAIEEQRMDALRILLERGADPNPSDETLGPASEHSEEPPLQKALRLMNAYTQPRSPPLREAAEGYRRVGVRLLLRYGADPDVGEPERAGETPLGSAIKHHDRPMVEDLLKHGAAPNGAGELGFREIITYHDNETLSLLLAYGLDAASVNFTLSELKQFANTSSNPEAFALMSSFSTENRSDECAKSDPRTLSESCLPRRLSDADREMGKLYRTALAKSPPAAQEPLKNGQRHWLKQRNIACRLTLEPSTEGGWRSYVLDERNRAICVLQQTERRIAYLGGHL